MRRGRIFIYIAFIIILGLVAFVVVWQRFLLPAQTVSEPEAVPTPVVDLVNVIVVTQRISRGTPLDENVLGMVPIQRELFIQGMFTNVDEIRGRLAKFDLDSGIPLTSGMLVDSAEQLSRTGSVAALSIPRGMVAVSIPISRLSAVSYAPQAGDHVNVILTMMFVDLDTDYQSILPNRNIGVIAPGAGEVKLGSQSGAEMGTETDQMRTQDTADSEALIDTSSVVAVSGAGGGLQGRVAEDALLGQTFFLIPSERQRPRMVSQNLLQDAVILQVGDFPLEEEVVSEEQAAADAEDAPAPEETGAEATPEPEPQKPDVITLIVSPQDAITLNYLLYQGAQLTLALRSAEDDSRIQTEAVTLQYLLDTYDIPVPVKLPYGNEPRVDMLVPPVLENDSLPPAEN